MINSIESFVVKNIQSRECSKTSDYSNIFLECFSIQNYDHKTVVYKATGSLIFSTGVYIAFSKAFLYSIPLLFSAGFLCYNFRNFSKEARFRDPESYNRIKNEVEKLKNETISPGEIVQKLPAAINDLRRYGILSENESKIFSDCEQSLIEMKEIISSYKQPIEDIISNLKESKVSPLYVRESFNILEELENWINEVDVAQKKAHQSEKSFRELHVTLIRLNYQKFSHRNVSYSFLQYLCKIDQFEKLQSSLKMSTKKLELVGNKFYLADRAYRELKSNEN